MTAVASSPALADKQLLYTTIWTADSTLPAPSSAARSTSISLPAWQAVAGQQALSLPCFSGGAAAQSLLLGVLRALVSGLAAVQTVLAAPQAAKADVRLVALSDIHTGMQHLAP